jgi:hypothetical protein
MKNTPLFAGCTSSRLSLKVVVFVTVLTMLTGRYISLLRKLTLEQDGAIEEASFIPHQTTNLSPNNSTAQEIDDKPIISPTNKTIDKKVNVATEKPKKIKYLNKMFTKVTLKIPTPVLVASLPKSGTTSIWKYFDCGGQPSSHQVAKLNETWSNNSVLGTGSKVFGGVMVSGKCMDWNVKAGKKYLEGCGNYTVWTDTGMIPGGKEERKDCYYPAIDGLDEWFKSYPNSTIILATRNTDSWVHSATSWGKGSLLERWDRCKLTGFVGKRAKKVAQFYKWHMELVRDFARKHPSITYIEVQLEDPNIASILHAKTGIPSSCWGHCKPDPGGRRQCTVVEVPNETTVS